MHYRPITRHGATPLPLVAHSLTPLERQVVLIAARDGRASVRRSGPARRLCDRLLGIRRANTLADPRLEALRRFCVGRRTQATAAERSTVLADCTRLGLHELTLRAAAMPVDRAVEDVRGGLR